MNTTPTQKLFNAIIACNADEVAAMFDPATPYMTRYYLANTRNIHIDMTPLFVACGLWRKANKENKASDAAKFNRICEILTSNGASITDSVQRKFNRNTSRMDPATGITLAMEFNNELPLCILKTREIQCYERRDGEAIGGKLTAVEKLFELEAAYA